MTTTPLQPTEPPPYDPWRSDRAYRPPAAGLDDPLAPPPAAVPPIAPPPGRRPRRWLAALVLAGCVAAGATGGAVVAVLDDPPPAAVVSAGTDAGDASTLSRSSAPLVDEDQATPAGTPESAAAVIAPSVVTIAVTGASAEGFGGQSVSGTGSGVVIRSDGYVLTNNHVVSVAAEGTGGGSGGSVSVVFADGTTSAATIVGADATTDLAVIKVDRTDLTAATFADSDDLAVGQAVLAVGAPLGLSNTVTEGIVSTLHRPVRTGEDGATEQAVLDAIQTDAAINPGNSGGPLVDLAGRVVGINSAIATASGDSSGNIGVGFAIPSNDAYRVANELIEDGTASHTQIGVSVAAGSTGNGLPGSGALVSEVSTGGPAAAAGLQAGDVITRVGERVVTDADSLIVAVRSHAEGESVPVTFERDGRTTTVQVVLVSAG